MALTDLLKRAIDYAEKGFPVYKELSQVIQNESGLLKKSPDAERILLKEGKPPKTGERLVQTELAESLKKIALEGRDAFYDGEIGRALVQFSKKNEGVFTEKDLEDHRSTWVEPMETSYKGYRVCVVPPNSQGVARCSSTR